MSRYLVAGGTGFVGTALINRLRTLGHKTTILSRKTGPNAIKWHELDTAKIGEFDYIINCCGSQFLDPLVWWNEATRNEIISSRVGTSAVLKEFLEKDENVKRYVQLTGVGAYPYSKAEVFTEKSDLSHFQDGLSETHQKPHFLQQLVYDWEDAGKTERSTFIRSGVVLGREGGAFAKQLPIYKLGLGVKLGAMIGSFAGDQYFPWIHIDDLVSMILFCAESEENLKLVNGVSPQIVTQSQFNDSFKVALNRPLWFPPPPFNTSTEFFVETAFGKDRADMLLKGMQVLPQTAMDAGFEWKFDTIQQAMDDLCKSKTC